jgi:hypothetical protein
LSKVWVQDLSLNPGMVWFQNVSLNPDLALIS